MAAFVCLQVGCFETPARHNGNLYVKCSTPNCSVGVIPYEWDSRLLSGRVQSGAMDKVYF